MESEGSSQRIAVTGATGRVGSHLVEILEQRGHNVIPIARSKGVDVVTGEGLDEALAGAETIIDTATGPRPTRKRRRSSSPLRHGTSSEPAPQPGRSGSSSSRSSASTSSRAATTRRRWRRSRRCSKARCRSGSCGGPVPRVRRPLVGWTIQDGVATCPRCERSSWPPASSPKPSPTPPRSRDPERQDHRDRRPAGRASRRCGRHVLPPEGTPSRSARAVAAGGARRSGRRRLCGGRRAAQPGREARRPQLRRVARGGLRRGRDHHPHLAAEPASLHDAPCACRPQVGTRGRPCIPCPS